MSQNSLLTREQIEAIIPHRGKWLLLDEVLKIGNGRIVAVKTFTEKECEGHFGVVPGHLICESAAQAGAVLVLYQYPELKKDKIFLARTSGQFFSSVGPGEKLLLEVKLQKMVLTMGIAFLKGFIFRDILLPYIAEWEGVGKTV